MSMRRGYELQGLFLNRTIRPFHLAVALATSTVAYLCLFIRPDGWANHATGNGLGVAALASSALLVWGWWFRSDKAAEYGLLTAVGVWAARAAYVLLSGTPSIVSSPAASFFFSLAWTIGATGAYLLERYDHEMWGEDE